MSKPFNIFFSWKALCIVDSPVHQHQSDNNGGNLLIYPIYFEVYRNVKLSNPIYSPMSQCVQAKDGARVCKRMNEWKRARVCMLQFRVANNEHICWTTRFVIVWRSSNNWVRVCVYVCALVHLLLWVECLDVWRK